MSDPHSLTASGYSGIGQEQVTRILRGEDNPDKNSGDNKQSFDVRA